MTYRAATYGLAHLGISDGEARHICDGCGAERLILSGNRVAPPGWFLQGKPPPGWRHGPKIENAARRVYCPQCGNGGARNER